jgi:hypothetical protein
MPTAMPPIHDKDPYGKEKWGHYGELGEGANAKIRFLQTVISHQELNDITLISSIPGSEKWDVRDLFQRDVDGDRVENEIMPYFKDQEKVKFFNPLTLIILPMTKNARNVLKIIEYVEAKSGKQNDRDYEIFEKKGYYKLSILKDSQDFGKIEWNDKKCFVVAIDGQHRLSALKRWKKEPASTDDLDSWKIPVVILTIFKVNKDKKTASLLEIVRKTFVYINTQAVQVNDARKILLNDESINHICTQELIQYSHENDCKDLKDRDEKILPLVFYDWRGETQLRRQIQSPASIKSIEEINNWFEEYILDEDGSDCQQVELNLTDLVPPLQCIISDAPITHVDAKRIREQFHKTVMPGILYMIQNFIPYKEYIKECRKIEKEAIKRSDVAQHAFMKLRFGTHNASEEQMEAVHRQYLELVERFEGLKNKMPEIINREIGMRGVVCAFGNVKKDYEEIFDVSISWIDYAKWVMKPINKIFKEGWFISFNDMEKEKRKYLTHVIFDESGTIINYKIGRAEDALGAFLAILILHKQWEEDLINDDDLINIWETYSDKLRKVIDQGFRKTYKAKLKDTFTGTLIQFNAEVRKKAASATTRRIKEIANYLDIDV